MQTFVKSKCFVNIAEGRGGGGVEGPNVYRMTFSNPCDQDCKVKTANFVL